MLRRKLARKQGGEEVFSWRGQEISRIEGFSDAVFAFAVTLLVVSLEVPKTFDELLSTLSGVVAFSVCFALLYAVWQEHYKFSRRYGLWDDAVTARLNAALLFIVLLYVYPLKFLFTYLSDVLLGFSTNVRLPSGAVVETIRDDQIPLLMVIYGAGFVALQIVFVLLYLRAYSMRESLRLNAYERSVTREEIQGFLLMAAVGLISISISLIGGTDGASWAGLAYLLIFPLQTANGYLMNLRRKNLDTPEADATPGETDDR